jgi:two-component system chemotaxis response regulator CheY
MKILVVDDSKTMLRIICNILKQIGFTNIDTAENGQIAWYKLNEKESNYSILMTDWNMPVLNGLELVKRVRNKEEFEDMPIVMITTEGGKREVITALKAGVNNYIVKPFTPEVLRDKLKDIVL